MYWWKKMSSIWGERFPYQTTSPRKYFWQKRNYGWRMCPLPLSVPCFVRVTWHDHMPTMRSRSRTCQWTANMEGRRSGSMEKRHDDDDSIFMWSCEQLQHFQVTVQAEITTYQFRTSVEGTLKLEFSLSYEVGFQLRNTGSVVGRLGQKNWDN